MMTLTWRLERSREDEVGVTRAVMVYSCDGFSRNTSGVRFVIVRLHPERRSRATAAAKPENVILA
jgi:hypothetical protein